MNKKQVFISLLILLFSLAVYVFLPPDMPEAARRMAFIFVLCGFLWATDIIPLYATSLLVVVLETFMLCRPNGILGMDENGYETIFLPLGSSTIILFFGGFVLARAMNKFKADHWIAVNCLKFFGRKPFNILLGFMTISAFLAMWMTISATAAMFIPIVYQLIRHMPEGDRFRVGLMLSVPFAATIGALGTPVATPPNALAIAVLTEHNVQFSFFNWLLVAFPLVVVLIGITAVMFYMIYPSKQAEWNLELRVEKNLSYKAIAVLMIALGMIILWTTSGWHKIPVSMVALLGAGIFAMTGLLNKDDFRNIEWDILILMWGGLALGKGIEISGLSQWVMSLPLFQQHGFGIVVLFVAIAGILSAFMSNTATANLILPLAMSLPDQNHLVVVLSVTFACTLSMGLPISTPALAMVYATGVVKNRQIITIGFIFSIIAIITAILWIKLLESTGLLGSLP